MVIVQPESVRQFAIKIFESCGSPSNEAAVVADHLVTANLMGFDSHGLIRIPQYIEGTVTCDISPGARMTIEKEEGNTAVLDCGGNFGQVGGLNAMEIAIEKASRNNVSMVVAHHCNHVGRLGAYTEMAARRGFISLAVCNSGRHGHFVLPWGGREGRLATNPISFAFPIGDDDPILADFSTSEVPEGVLRLYCNRGMLLPEKWIVDAEGNPSNNPNDFYGPPRGAIMPFGGPKGYRGYALSLLVEVLGGLLGGAHILVDRPGNGIAFLVLNISAFLSESQYLSLISEVRDYMKASAPAPGFESVLLPGELEFGVKRKRLREGIPLDVKTWEQICSAAARLGVASGLLCEAFRE
jgi:LDH2 family malate/lactate/ureidoglycolate dehydrogenase